MWLKLRKHDALTKVAQDAVDRVLRSAVALETERERLHQDAEALRKEVSELRLDKACREEDYARRERELEHKVGLERLRQEAEKTATRREALLDVKETALKKDQDRFTEQLKFHEDRFSKEVSYLKELLEQVLQALPQVQFRGKAELPRRRKTNG